jgi:hypothetical protein
MTPASFSYATASDSGPWARFIGWATAGAAVALLSAFLLITLTLAAGREKLPYQVLLDYQRSKLDRPLGDVVFVGDSSLGNAIDAAAWSALSGRSASNLALTGAFGYRGSLAMIEAVLERRRPTDVVIMHTAEMMMRSPQPVAPIDPPQGVIARIERAWLDTMNLDQLRNAWLFALAWRAGEAKAVRTHTLENDYVKQGDRKPVLPTKTHLNAEKLKPTNFALLTEIAALCRKRGLNCVYTHGPLASPVCEQSQRYFEAVNAAIRAAGLTVAGKSSLCLSPAELGDSLDHAAPQAKVTVTERYFKLISPRLSARLENK